MNYLDICEKVEKLRRKYDESDPFVLCRNLGIIILSGNFGTAPDSIKGFYLECKRIQTITVNADLPLVLQKAIVTHELGHAMLHRKSGLYLVPDVFLFNSISQYEREANLFAAEYLLEDNIVLDTLKQEGVTLQSAAAELMVPMELLAYKIFILRWKGVEIKDFPFAVKSDFLRRLDIPSSDF